MNSKIKQWISSFFLGTVFASSASATMITATFDGTFFLSLGGSFPNYIDQTGLMPFGPPVDGTAFQLVATYDTEASLQNPPTPGGNPNAHSLYLESLSLEFDSNYFSEPTDNGLVIINDDFNSSLGQYMDLWQLLHYVEDPNNPDISIIYGVIFYSLFDTPTGGPLDSIDTSVPTGPGWDSSLLFYQITDNSGVDPNDPFSQPQISRIQAYVTDVNVQAVPLPATVWLFGSAILGTLAVRRQQRRA